jgi:arginase
MKNSVTLISIPYDSAHFNKRMGAGPRHILSHGLIEKIQRLGCEVFFKEVLTEEDFPTEIATCFELLDLLRKEISRTRKNRSLPIVLAGNCSATVGVVAGLKSNDPGVIWFDAHGDCETPETTTSGFLDGMGIPMVLNRCWEHLLSSYNLTSSLRSENIVLIGARDLSKSEEQFIKTNAIKYFTVDAIKRSNTEIAKAAFIELTRSGVRQAHLHIDVDVFDPSVAHSNSYEVKDGLARDEVINLINCCMREIGVTSVTIASYDPSFDADGAMLNLIHGLIETIVVNYHETNA